MNPPADNLILRKAVPQDAALVLDFIRAIADYEKLAHQVVATEDDIRHALAAEPPIAECMIAEWRGRPAGFALFHPKFSTFTGRCGIHLEDLFVHPEFRGTGIGRALFREIIRIASHRGCPRVEWVALDWNEPALEFYRAHQASELREWRVFRLEGDALAAASAKPGG